MKLNYKQTIFVGLAFLSISSFWQLYDNIIPLMLQNGFSLGETSIGVIMALDNVTALFLLPFFGALSDRTHTRIGRRKPFIIGGTIIAVALMILMPRIVNSGNFYMFFVVLGLLLIAMSFYRAPAVALMPDVTPKPLRSKANAVINLMGALGAVFSLLMIKFLIPHVENPDYTMVFVSVAVFMFVMVTIMCVTTNEKELSIYTEEEEEEHVKAAQMPSDVRRSLIRLLFSIFLWFTAYNAVTTAFSRYAIKQWGMKGGGFASALMVAMVAAVISFIPIGFIASKIGRKKTILAGIILMSVAYFCGFLFKHYSPMINVVFAMTGVGWASINVNSYPMVVEMSKAGDIGKYTGLYYTFSMAAQIFTPIFSGFLLENVSYRILFPYACIFSIFSFICMLGVKHGDSRPLKKIEEFHLED